MHWLIVEDALRDRTGHWFEYVSTFVHGLAELGDQVTVLADSSAEPFILEGLNAKPVLAPSIWHKMSDGSSALRRYLRVPVHAWRTFSHMSRWLAANADTDPNIIFVPTVLVHHLLGWTGLIKWRLAGRKLSIILFFASAPIQLNAVTNTPEWTPSPTAKLFCWLIQRLRNEVAKGSVVLGAETAAMQQALTTLTGVPFQYFPHPVSPLPESNHPASSCQPPSSAIGMASYGGARAEKGEETLIKAVNEYSSRPSALPVHFRLQCVGGRKQDWQLLEGKPNIELIDRYFKAGEYGQYLQSTQALLLPYRRSSYGLRVSRVAIEAMVNGIPFVATDDTTLATQAEQYGAAVLCADGNVDSLVQAIDQCASQSSQLLAQAQARKLVARDHFSIGGFRRILLGILEQQPQGALPK